MGLLAERFRVQASSPRSVLSARHANSVIHVDPNGLCWSRVDPADALLPTIPRILSVEKEPVPLEQLRAMYMRRTASGHGIVKLVRRLEASTTWDELRATGDCALTPDEKAVAGFLIGSRGRCMGLSDFPKERTKEVYCGKRRYFEAELQPQDVKEGLRCAGERDPNNLYLPRDGVVMLPESRRAAGRDWMGLLDGLGEWCYFTPV